MKSRHLANICTILLLAAQLHAQTQPMDISASGNNFLEICSSVDVPVVKATATDVRNMGLCQGYMDGLRDGVGVSIAILQHDNPSLGSLKGSVEDFGICFPEGVNLMQAIRVVLKYIRDHPGQAHLPSATLIVMAELDAFHCAKPVQRP